MDVGLCGKVYTFKPPIIIAASFTTWERSGEDHLHLDEAKNLTMTLIMRGVRIYTGGTSRSWNTQLHGTAHAIVLEHEGLHILQRLLREAVKRKKVTFLWTLSVGGDSTLFFSFWRCFFLTSEKLFVDENSTKC